MTEILEKRIRYLSYNLTSSSFIHRIILFFFVFFFIALNGCMPDQTKRSTIEAGLYNITGKSEDKLANSTINILINS